MTKIVAICGSLREGSSNTALLQAAASVAPDGVEVVFYDGMGDLPHFNPDLDAEGSTPPEAVQRLRQLLIGADALLISSPEYAHGVPGAFKNLLDWLVSTGELVGKPVALLNAAPVGGEYAQSAIVETLRTMNWRVVDAASRIEPFVSRKGALDAAALETLRQVVHTLVHTLAMGESHEVVFAPALVAHTPQSMTLEIGDATIEFNDVDLNAWFADALEAINERAIPAKQSLASSIAASLVPVGEDDEAARAIAVPAFEKALLENLTLNSIAVSGQSVRIFASDTPIRRLPSPAAIMSQTAEPSKQPHDDPSALALWDYSFTFAAPEEDAVIARIELGAVPKTSGADERLFRALARFKYKYPDVDDEMFEEIAAAYAARRNQRLAKEPSVNVTSAEGLNILKVRSATAVVQVARNAESPAFRMVSAPTTATMPAPRLTHGSYDLSSLTATSLDGYLDAFFRALLGDAQVTVRIACAYRDDVSQVPVVLLSDQSLAKGWATAFVEVIKEWYLSQQPPPGIFTFQVTVSDDGTPLIEIKDLHISSETL